jgi:hypothetical protein
VVVPAHPAPGGAGALPPREPMRLGEAMASREYLDELAARRAALQPEGPWATWWAKRFHDWRPPAEREASGTTRDA